MKKLLIGSLMLLPAMTLAADGVAEVVAKLIDIADNLYILVFTVIVLAFAWGVLKFIFQNGEDQDKGKGMMVWAIIALFVLVSVWGIIQILQNTLGIQDENSINAPTIPNLVIPDRNLKTTN